MTLLEIQFDDRRVRYERVADGPEPYQRVEEHWTGCRWRFVGREFLADLDVQVASTADKSPPFV